MQALRRVTILAIVLALAIPALAQDAKPEMPKPESVLDHVPAGAMGYVITRDLKTLGANVDKFLTAIGMAEQMNLSQVPGGSMGLIQMQAQLGEGFNTNGQFAVVMLDTKAYNIDWGKLMEGTSEQKLPFVILVPGTGVKEVFGAYRIEDTDAGQVVHLNMGPMFAQKVGGEVDKGDIFMFVDMKIAGPEYLKIMRQTTEQYKRMMSGMGGPEQFMVAYLEAVTAVYDEMIPQMSSVWATMRFADSGIALNETLDWKEDSQIGKIVKSYPTAEPAKLLGSLPSLPYVLAMGYKQSDSAEYRELNRRMLSSIFKSEAMAKIPEADRKALETKMVALNESITEVQFVGGGPADVGLFGITAVVKSADSAKTQQDIVDLVQSILKTARTMAPDEEDLQKFSITLSKDLEKVEGKSVDAMEISHADMAVNMDADDRAEMAKVIGEDKFRILMAKPDDKTLVLTFGGALPTMSASLQSIGKDRIVDANATKALKELGVDKSAFVMLFNAGNLFDVIVKGAQKMDPGGEAPPFQVTAKTPVVLALTTSETRLGYHFFLPNDVVKDIINVSMMFWAPTVGAGGGPVMVPAEEW